MNLLAVKRSVSTALLCALSTAAGVRGGIGQELRIGIIDFYGLNRVSAVQLRPALTFNEGDTIALGSDDLTASILQSEERLAKVAGVLRARANVVCCDQGRAIVFVGIQEDGASVMRFRAAPQGASRLPSDLVAAGREFTEAFRFAVQRGDTEDDSRGHALNGDPGVRVIQERFIRYAERDPRGLRRILREASDPEHRALAAQVLGYVSDKQAVVGELVYAMEDPSESVRNNAMRTLLVFAKTTRAPSRPVPRIPYQPFIAWLTSPVWTDRNKASGALRVLSTDRDPALLAMLRRDSIGALVEMARWKSRNHAEDAFFLLGRVAGISEDAIRASWERGDHDVVIAAALKGR
jgi:hypothetical protein